MENKHTGQPLEEFLKEEDIPEKSQRQCKVCGLIKVHEPAYVNKQLRTISTDANKERWYGRMCPDCNREYDKLRKRNKKLAKASE